MPLKSALEDLLETTLASVPGVTGKIDYVASLRDAATGHYSHWGFARAYGEQAAQAALAEAHRRLFLRLLRTPLSSVRDDVQASSRAADLTEGEFVARLQERMTALIPRDLSGGSELHFSSVLHALSILVSGPAKDRPAASPPA